MIRDRPVGNDGRPMASVDLVNIDVPTSIEIHELVEGSEYPVMQSNLKDELMKKHLFVPQCTIASSSSSGDKNAGGGLVSHHTIMHYQKNIRMIFRQCRVSSGRTLRACQLPFADDCVRGPGLQMICVLTAFYPLRNLSSQLRFARRRMGKNPAPTITNGFMAGICLIVIREGIRPVRVGAVVIVRRRVVPSDGLCFPNKARSANSIPMRAWT